VDRHDPLLRTVLCLALHSPPSSLLYSPPPHRDLHSFPTRRSSDLRPARAACVRSHLPGRGPLAARDRGPAAARLAARPRARGPRSEEHTSELQSRENIVCRLLLEKKKKNKTNTIQTRKISTYN